MLDRDRRRRRRVVVGAVPRAAARGLSIFCVRRRCGTARRRDGDRSGRRQRRRRRGFGVGGGPGRRWTAGWPADRSLGPAPRDAASTRLLLRRSMAGNM